MRLLAFVLMIFTSLLFTNVAYANNDETLYYLYEKTCPVCEDASKFLDQLIEKTEISVVRIEFNNDNERFEQLLDEYSISTRAVPIFIYKHTVWQGFNPVVEESITNSVTSGTVSDGGLEDEDACDLEQTTERFCPQTESNLTFYRWEFKKDQLLFPTVIIGLVDGFNPCTLWALMFLISMIIRFNSRKTILIVGTTFIFTISLIYGLFVAGTFSILTNILDFFFIRFSLFSFALFFALVNVVEYFSSDKMTFSISTNNKKKFVQRVREKLFSTKNYFHLIIATIGIAVFASLIELPCTAGFPIIWNGIMIEHQVATSQYFSLLLIYLIMYVLVETVVVVFMTLTLSKVSMTANYGKTLKFVSGALMLFLSVILLLGKQYINNMTLIVGGSIIVILTSIIFTFVYKKSLALH